MLATPANDPTMLRFRDANEFAVFGRYGVSIHRKMLRACPTAKLAIPSLGRGISERLARAGVQRLPCFDTERISCVGSDSASASKAGHRMRMFDSPTKDY